jgi:hypothetical protein
VHLEDRVGTARRELGWPHAQLSSVSEGFFDTKKAKGTESNPYS